MFPWSQCRGIRTFLELRGTGILFSLQQDTRVPLEFQQVRQASSCGVSGSWDSSELKQGMSPHLEMRWGTQGLLSGCGGKLRFLLSCDGCLWEPLELHKGSQNILSSFKKELGVALLGAAGNKGPHRVLTGESRGFS